MPYGDFGGGISDDVDLTEQWPGLALMGVDPDKINASLRALSDAVYTNGMRVNGLGYITTDELHAYEEGLNSDAERLYLNWGEPKAIERLMVTVKALQGLILVNPAGHMHFASNWYGGRKVYREGAWEWQKPYSFTVMHAPILMGVYNANPTAEGLVTGVIDGWMAHGKQGADGKWNYPNEINWRSDDERKGDGGGLTTPLQSAWAAWRFTGDEKYLRPIEAGGRPGPVRDQRGLLPLPIGKAARRGPGDFGRYAAWQKSGDTALAGRAPHRRDRRQDADHMYMYTEGHWWSDRVDQPNDLLQRERLGGIALRRNQTYPGNTVSWRFEQPHGAEQVAILMPNATREHFRVIAYNMSDTPQNAEMTTWNVTTGHWTMRSGKGADVPIDLERSATTTVSFAPHVTTELEFTLVKAGEDTATRPDIGIGADDVAVKGRTVTVTVHSLGAKDAPAGTATLVDASGHVLASTPIPAIAAPLDLTPKTARVRLMAPAGAAPAFVQIALAGDAREVTLLNNRVPLGK